MCLKSREVCVSLRIQEAGYPEEGSLDFIVYWEPLEGVREGIYIFKADPATRRERILLRRQTILTLSHGHPLLSPLYI